MNGLQLINSTTLAPAPDASAKARTAKLTDGAHAFEAMMLEQMLKPLKFGATPGTGTGDDSTDSASDTIQGYGTEALAKSIASQGGFGIARQIIRQVTAEVHAKEGAKVP